MVAAIALAWQPAVVWTTTTPEVNDKNFLTLCLNNNVTLLMEFAAYFWQKLV